MDNAAKPSPCFSQHVKVSILEGSRQPHFASPSTTLSFATTECERIINPDKEGIRNTVAGISLIYRGCSAIELRVKNVLKAVVVSTRHFMLNPSAVDVTRPAQLVSIDITHQP